MKDKNWVVLLSRSGKTYEAVARQLQRPADKVYHSDKENYKDIYKNLLNYDSKDTIITLMGWLRIVPPYLCDAYNIYNLHPAPLHLQNTEWLKGKDPIERFVDQCKVINKDSTWLYGSVIHAVVPQVDAGQILACSTFSSKPDLEEMYKKSFKTNVGLWTTFLGGLLCE
jgi:folate-dependent phosphoribosylglycinamide formyltransferase PurN